MALDKRPPKKDFQKEVIEVLREVPPEESRGVEIAVVRWITDGTAYAPQLISQEVYTDRLDRKRKYGKLKGLKWSDYNFLTETPERRAHILDLLSDARPGTHKPKVQSGQDAAANDYATRGVFSDDEEVPF